MSKTTRLEDIRKRALVAIRNARKDEEDPCLYGGGDCCKFLFFGWRLCAYPQEIIYDLLVYYAVTAMQNRDLHLGAREKLLDYELFDARTGKGRTDAEEPSFAGVREVSQWSPPPPWLMLIIVSLATSLVWMLATFRF